MQNVSVIIPVYNRAGMVGRAIDSVLAQQGAGDVEIIVIDDGSTDGSADVVRAKYPQVRVAVQSNAGPSAARNHGIRMATGEFMAFLDSDDELVPDSLAVRMLALLANPEVDLVCGNFINCVNDQQGGPTNFDRHALIQLIGPPPAPTHLKVIPRFFDAQLRCPLFLTSALMVRRCAIIENEFFNESLRMGEDWEFCLRFSLRHQVGMMMPVVVKRHVHGANLARSEFGGKHQVATDRAVLSYACLTDEQRRFAQARLADNLYEYAYACVWGEGTRMQALRALAESMWMRMNRPKLKLLAACLLPGRVARRWRGGGRRADDG